MNPFKLFLAALWVLGARRSALLQALAPALLAHGAFALWSALAPEAALAALPGAMLLALALHVLVSVNVLRLVLLGPQAVPPLGLAPWGRRQWRFLAALGLQALAMTFAMLAFAPLAFLGAPGLAICAAAGVFAAGRASLLLPEAALDRPFDGRVLWQRGQGASLALAIIVLVPLVLQALLLGPLGGDGGWALSLLLTLLAQGASAWTTATLALAAGTLERQAQEASSPADPAEAPPPLEVTPDVDAGILRITLRGTLATQALGQAAEGDPCVAAHGRLKGVLLSLEGASWSCASEQSASALDTVLSHLGILRVHQTHLLRVALLGDGGWVAQQGMLGKHFPDAEVRVGEEGEAEALEAWLKGA